MTLVAACSAGEKPPRPIVLVPIGNVSADVLVHLQSELASVLEQEVTIAKPIPVPKIDPKRQQYQGTVLLDELAKHDDPNADRMLGVIDADAYAPGLNFIFGQAKLPGRFAVIALPRLRWRADEARFRERAAKEAVHELGHSFGFRHCADSKCVMHFSNSPGDTDRKGVRYCSREIRNGT